MKKNHIRFVFLSILILSISGIVVAAGGPPADAPVFPPSLESYGDKDLGSIVSILGNRIRQEPFNLVASLIFLLCHHPHLSHRPFHGHRPPVGP